MSQPYATAIPAIKDKEYEFIRNFVYENSRINLGTSKKDLVTTRLSKRIRKINMKNFGEYIDLIRSPAGEAERINLIDCISTNHTFFFREESHFDFLLETIVPQFKKTSAKKHLNVWSAACSSGEEAYTIAISLDNYLNNSNDFSWSIDCSDISTRILERAAKGIFSIDRFRQMEKRFIKKYFLEGYNEWEGYAQAKPVLRNHLRFCFLNLVQPSYHWTDLFHVVFLRNVMIYFDKQTQEEVVSSIFKYIHPGGYLIIGQSESLTGVPHPYKMVQPSIYQKPK